jgi:hypothetical protein
VPLGLGAEQARESMVTVGGGGGIFVSDGITRDRMCKILRTQCRTESYIVLSLYRAHLLVELFGGIFCAFHNFRPKGTRSIHRNKNSCSSFVSQQQQQQQKRSKSNKTNKNES